MAENVSSNMSNSTAGNMSVETRRTPHGFDVQYHVGLIFISLLVIFSNILVIILFIHKETLRKGGKLLLLSLAISDLTTGLVTIPLNIGCEVTFSLALCMSSGMLNRFVSISTVYHILAITFETYYAILRPMEHKVKIERKMIVGIALVIWCVSLIIALVPLTWSIGVVNSITERPEKQFFRKMSIYEAFVVLFGFFLPLFLMIFAHARMFTTIINALKLLRQRSNATQSKVHVHKNNYKTAILFAILLLVFTACWLFWFVVSLLKALFEVQKPFPLWAIDALTIIRYSTSFINPLLYTFFRPDFYTAFKSLPSACRRVPSGTMAYLLTGYHRAKRDSQTTTTIVRESSTTPMISASSPKFTPSKILRRATTV